MTERPAPAAVAAAAVLADDVRRALFDAVRSSEEPLSREEAAAAVGISRKLAAFHLDKLLDAGLLVAVPGGTTGRVGRRPKRYAPTDLELRISLPPRKPELLAELLAEAVTSASPQETAMEAALRLARERGRAAGEAAARTGPAAPARPAGRLGAERALALMRTVLERLDYEPSALPSGEVRFRSCPFHPLATRQPELVCGVNHAYLAGLVEGLRVSSVEAVLAPGSGQCCVELRRAGR